MWCVAELTDDYITHMEDVLETYEQPYDPKEPVVCVDEKPVSWICCKWRRRERERLSVGRIYAAMPKRVWMK